MSINGMCHKAFPAGCKRGIRITKPCPPRPCFCRCIGPQGPKGDPGPPGPQGPQGDPGPAGLFLSSYVEAVGNTQDVEQDANIVFDASDEALDLAGNDIELDASGSVFTIKRAGLYHVEWSINMRHGENPVLIGLMENAAPSSGLFNTAQEGNFSSGALLNVTNADLPYTVSLHNFGAPMTLENPGAFENIAASIRILRFADGPAI